MSIRAEYSMQFRDLRIELNRIGRALAGAAVLLPCPVVAGDTENFEAMSSSAESIDLSYTLEPEEKQRVRDDWFVRIGVLGGYTPDYLGADRYEPGYSPTAKIVWRDLLFLNDRSLGVNLYRNDYLAVGALARYTGGRGDNDEELRGLGEISRTLTAGGFVNARYQGIRFKAEVRHDILGEEQGTMVTTALGAKLPWRAPLLSVYVSGTWVDSTYMTTFFGITPVQSFNSGLRRYDAGAGFRDVSVSLSSGYQFDEHWQLSGQMQYRRLVGDAADSPIVSDEGNRDQLVAGLRLSYTF